jgi:hypothetical protein
VTEAQLLAHTTKGVKIGFVHGLNCEWAGALGIPFGTNLMQKNNNEKSLYKPEGMTDAASATPSTLGSRPTSMSADDTGRTSEKPSNAITTGVPSESSAAIPTHPESKFASSSSVLDVRGT